MQNPPVLVDILALATKEESRSGPVWGHECEDMDMTLLVWKPGEGVSEHANEEVDVLVVALAGEARITIGDMAQIVQEGQAILIPKSSLRSILALELGFSHLNVHKRRKRLTPTLGTHTWSNRQLP